MKKILNLIIVLIISLVVSSCVDTTNENKLVIKVADNLLVWDNYPGANSYNIYIDNILCDTISESEYELKLKEGTYKIKINAVLEIGYSSFSNVLEYYSDGSNYDSGINSLEKPVIKLVNGILSWNKVLNAEEYEIYKNNSLLATTKNLNYPIEENSGDTYYVISKGYNISSEKSNIIEIGKATNTGVVNVFSINDTHGAVATNSNVTGLDKVETLIN